MGSSAAVRLLRRRDRQISKPRKRQGPCGLSMDDQSKERQSKRQRRVEGAHHDSYHQISSVGHRLLPGLSAAHRCADLCGLQYLLDRMTSRPNARCLVRALALAWQPAPRGIRQDPGKAVGEGTVQPGTWVTLSCPFTSAFRSSIRPSSTLQKWSDQMPSSTSSRPMRYCFKAVDRYSKRVLKRMVPALVTRFTRKWSGYARAGGCRPR